MNGVHLSKLPPRALFALGYVLVAALSLYDPSLRKETST
jgi:hypothetical protein